jgi:hypothetical protein
MLTDQYDAEQFSPLHWSSLPGPSGRSMGRVKQTRRLWRCASCSWGRWKPSFKSWIMTIVWSLAVQDISTTCWKYVRLKVCEASPTPTAIKDNGLTSTHADATAVIQDEGSDDSSSTTWPRFDHQPTFASAPNPLETMMHLGIGDMEMFHLYSSDIYDPGLFEGLDRSSAESFKARNTEWENSSRIM